MRSINTSVIALLPVAPLLFVGAGGCSGVAPQDLALVPSVGLAEPYTPRSSWPPRSWPTSRSASPRRRPRPPRGSWPAGRPQSAGAGARGPGGTGRERAAFPQRIGRRRGRARAARSEVTSSRQIAVLGPARAGYGRQVDARWGAPPAGPCGGRSSGTVAVTVTAAELPLDELIAEHRGRRPEPGVLFVTSRRVRRRRRLPAGGKLSLSYCGGRARRRGHPSRGRPRLRCGRWRGGPAAVAGSAHRTPGWASSWCAGGQAPRATGMVPPTTPSSTGRRRSNRTLMPASGQRVLVVDDALATAGTLGAAISALLSRRGPSSWGASGRDRTVALGCGERVAPTVPARSGPPDRDYLVWSVARLAWERGHPSPRIRKESPWPSGRRRRRGSG